MSHPTAPDFSRPAPTPLDALPDHEFWNSHRSHSISTLASSPTSLAWVPRSPSIVDPPRKFSRKLPPKVTESLENLSWSTTSHSTFLPVTSYKRDKPFPSTPPGQYTLAVEAPSTEFGAIHAISPPSTRKASSSSTSSGPTESSSTMSIRTPYSSQVYSRPSFSSHASPLSCSSGSASACGSWSVLDEIESSERAAAARKTRESRKEKKVRKAAEDAAFDVDTPPHVRDLFEASRLEVIDEDGEKVRFGDLVRQRRTIVIFIRHWFCPLCAQYMNSILAKVSLDALEEADVDLVIIGNGSDKMLSAYRNKAFRCPFKMYTDPSLAVYRALGLTRKTGNAGPDEDKGDYLVQTPLESTIQTLKRATVMPLRNPGHFLQLGGEFVFDGTLNVIYTHRMSTTRSHAPIRDVCAEAGVRLEFIHYEPGPPPPPVHRSSVILEEDEEDWRAQRDTQLERIRAMKLARRELVEVAPGKPEARRVDGEVRVVGEDGETDSLDDNFGALGLV